MIYAGAKAARGWRESMGEDPLKVYRSFIEITCITRVSGTGSGTPAGRHLAGLLAGVTAISRGRTPVSARPGPIAKTATESARPHGRLGSGASCRAGARGSP
jgi:hypothetical protein